MRDLNNAKCMQKEIFLSKVLFYNSINIVVKDP